MFPIPGTKRVNYLEENVAAYEISKTLTKQELADLEAAVPADQVRAGWLTDVLTIVAAVFGRLMLQKHGAEHPSV